MTTNTKKVVDVNYERMRKSCERIAAVLGIKDDGVSTGKALGIPILPHTA